MKKILCIPLILCLICSVAFADGLDDYNEILNAFSCDPLLLTQKSEANGFAFYDTGECIVTFQGEDAMYVEGKGELFIVYCTAAILLFDGLDSFTDECGRFLSVYLLARNGTEQTGTTASGHTFNISQYGDNLLFILFK